MSARLAELVRQAREARGLSLDDVAARCVAAEVGDRELTLVGVFRTTSVGDWRAELERLERGSGCLVACGRRLDVVALAIGITVAEHDAWDAADGAIPDDIRWALRHFPERASHVRAVYGMTADPAAHAASPWTPDPWELDAAVDGYLRARAAVLALAPTASQEARRVAEHYLKNAERAWLDPVVAVSEHDRVLSDARGFALVTAQDRDAARARVAELERELADARRECAALRAAAKPAEDSP